MNSLAADFRDALRALRRAPAATSIAVAILALAIGAAATLWQALDVVVLRPLPYAQPQQLTVLWDLHDGDSWPASPSNFTDYRDQTRSFSAVAAYNDGSYALAGGDGPAEQVAGASVTRDFFRVLGVAPEVGRLLGAEDDNQPVALLGHELWRRRFGGDPAIVGRTITVDGASRTVVGVLPAGQGFPLEGKLWMPLAFSEEDLRTQRGAHWLGVVARLRDGVTLAGARAELGALTARLAAAYPNTNGRLGATAQPLAEFVVGDARTTLALMLGAVALVMLAACANLANLSLARTVARARELSLRSSLGADAHRLARSLLLENLALAAAGAIAGGLLSAAALRALPGWLGDLPRLDQASFGSAGAVALGALAGVAGLLVGLAPAAFALRRDPIEMLRSGGRTVAGSRGAGRVRQTLVVLTTTLALVLVCGATLLVRSYDRVAGIDPGFQSSGRLLFSLSLPDATYPRAEDGERFVAALLDRLRAVPGVKSAGATFGQPFGGFGFGISLRSIDGRELPDDNSRRSPQIRVVTRDYLRTLGVPLRSGRSFSADDRNGSPGVVIANEAASRLIFAGADPLGHRLEIGTTMQLGRGRLAGEVIGIVGNLREQRLDGEPRPTLYFLHDQYPVGFLTFVVETTPERLPGIVAPVRAAAAAVDPTVPLFRVRTLDQVVAESLSTRRLLARLLAGFAAVAVALAALGLFGVLSQSVSERKSELAMRSALGATPAALARLVLAQAGALAALGLSGGVAALLPLSRYLREQLFELSPTDPATIAGAALFLLGVSLLSGWLPARRALRLDPMTVLRED